MNNREAFELWYSTESDARFYTSHKIAAWDGWQAACSRFTALHADHKKWRVDDLVRDIKGNNYIIEGVKANVYLVKDTDDNLFFMPSNQLNWRSRPEKEKQI